MDGFGHQDVGFNHQFYDFPTYDTPLFNYFGEDQNNIQWDGLKLMNKYGQRPEDVQCSSRELNLHAGQGIHNQIFVKREMDEEIQNFEWERRENEVEYKRVVKQEMIDEESAYIDTKIKNTEMNSEDGKKVMKSKKIHQRKKKEYRQKPVSPLQKKRLSSCLIDKGEISPEDSLIERKEIFRRPVCIGDTEWRDSLVENCPQIVGLLFSPTILKTTKTKWQWENGSPHKTIGFDVIYHGCLRQDPLDPHPLIMFEGLVKKNQ